MIQVNRIYLIFNRLVTKKFLVDTSDVYSKNAGGILVSDSLRVDDNWVFERKNGSFCIDKQQFPMEETIENNLGSNADIFI